MNASSKALNSLLKTVVNNRTLEGKPKSVVSSVIIFFVVLIALFVFSYVSNKQSKKLAQLRHEKNKRDIEAKNAETKQACLKNDIETTRLGAEIDQIKKEIRIIDRDIDIAKRAKEADYRAINAITNWRDIK